jgi:hypothetical protein
MSTQVESMSTTQSTEKKVKKVVTKKKEETVEPVKEVLSSTPSTVTTVKEVVAPTTTTTTTTATTVAPTSTPVSVEAVKETVQEEQSATEEVSKQLLEQFNDLSDKFTDFAKNMRNIDFGNKDFRTKFDATFRKFSKASSQLMLTYPEVVSKQLSVAEKLSHGRSSSKKTANKEKSAVNKKLPVDDNLLTFMGLDSGTMVSRAEALQAITGYVKSLKESGNSDIKVEGNNRAFKIVGKLQTLFKGIEKVMVERGDLKKGESMPDKITYIQIMKYMTYCFKKSDKSLTV